MEWIASPPIDAWFSVNKHRNILMVEVLRLYKAPPNQLQLFLLKTHWTRFKNESNWADRAPPLNPAVLLVNSVLLTVTLAVLFLNNVVFNDSVFTL